MAMRRGLGGVRSRSIHTMPFDAHRGDSRRRRKYVNKAAAVVFDEHIQFIGESFLQKVCHNLGRFGGDVRETEVSGLGRGRK